MVGSNRIIPGFGIVQPVGNADLDPKAEKALRRAIVEGALEALQINLIDQKVFPCMSMATTRLREGD